LLIDKRQGGLLPPFVLPNYSGTLPDGARAATRAAAEREDEQLTVCIAALCKDGVVFGITDRMLTADNIEFEPASPHKIWPLTSSIAAMAAANAAFNAEILQAVMREVAERLAAKPQDWLTVKEVAEVYVKHRAALQSWRAESALLAPLGLYRESFLAQQKMMDPQLVNRLADAMLGFAVPYTEVLFIGSDPIGPHIYMVLGSGLITSS
jgi:hypothetical protein